MTSNAAVRKKRLPDYAWITGALGTLVLCFFSYKVANDMAFENGLHVMGLHLLPDKVAISLFVLMMTGGIMFLSDLLIRIRVEGRQCITLHPHFGKKQYLSFFAECAGIFLAELLLIRLFILFYSHAESYDFGVADSYYSAFFPLLGKFSEWFMLFGFPYVALTHAFQYDAEDDRKSPALLVGKTLLKILVAIGVIGLLKKMGFLPAAKVDEVDLSYDKANKIAFRGLLVKLFFIPIMTVFFVANFPIFVAQFNYILDAWYSGSLDGVVRDYFTNTGYMYALTTSWLFMVDVGIGWSGYTIMSRWIRNTYVSVEPTFLGWFVAIICYPPFNDTIFTFFHIPSERSFENIELPWLNYLLVCLIVFSYLVYVLATIVFGLRFSNLTHRGIIRTGPYALIRHPAYASKNLSWWLAMFPATVYLAWTSDHMNYVDVLAYGIGLLTMSYLYYQRALTEERHLMMDPEYREYCAQVKYRFIPGVV